MINQIRRGWLLPDLTEAEANALDAYLNRAPRLLNKNYRHGIKQSALLNAYYASDAVALPIDLTSRIEQHRWGHSQVWDKLEAFRQRLAMLNNITLFDQPREISSCEGVTSTGRSRRLHRHWQDHRRQDRGCVQVDRRHA